MWTVQYRGYFIHGYYNRDECTIHSPDNKLMAAKSILAAQRKIKNLTKGKYRLPARRAS